MASCSHSRREVGKIICCKYQVTTTPLGVQVSPHGLALSSSQMMLFRCTFELKDKNRQRKKAITISYHTCLCHFTFLPKTYSPILKHEVLIRGKGLPLCSWNEAHKIGCLNKVNFIQEFDNHGCTLGRAMPRTEYS